jgi:hypothetical protein
MDLQRRRHLDRGSPLDPNLAERYLSGALAPDDLPPALGPLASVVEALRQDAMQTDAMRTDAMHTAQEQRTIDSMVALLADAAEHPVRRLRLRLRTPVLSRPLGGFRVRLATSLVAVALAFLMGMAYAGRLPGPAQSAASLVLSKVGLDLPRHERGGHIQPQDGSGEESGGSEDQSAVGPDPNGPAHDGLCNAYFHGNGGSEGGKYDSVAFQNLQKSAADSGQTVEEFCGVNSGSEEGTNQHGNSHEQHGQGNGGSEHQSGDQGQDEQSGDQGQDDQGSDQGSQGNSGDHGNGDNHGGGSHDAGSDDSQGSTPSD